MQKSFFSLCQEQTACSISCTSSYPECLFSLFALVNFQDNLLFGPGKSLASTFIAVFPAGYGELYIVRQLANQLVSLCSCSLLG